MVGGVACFGTFSVCEIRVMDTHSYINIFYCVTCVH